MIDMNKPMMQVIQRVMKKQKAIGQELLGLINSMYNIFKIKFTKTHNISKRIKWDLNNKKSIKNRYLKYGHKLFLV